MILCAVCQTPLVGRAHARFCSDRCRKRASRASANPDNIADNSDSSGAVYAATLRDLQAAGRVDSVAGAYCLAMAQRIDRGKDTGSALAAVCRQLQDSMDLLAQHVPDIVDELRAQRAQRQAQATGLRP